MDFLYLKNSIKEEITREKIELLNTVIDLPQNLNYDLNGESHFYKDELIHYLDSVTKWGKPLDDKEEMIVKERFDDIKSIFNAMTDMVLKEPRREEVITVEGHKTIIDTSKNSLLSDIDIDVKLGLGMIDINHATVEDFINTIKNKRYKDVFEEFLIKKPGMPYTEEAHQLLEVMNSESFDSFRDYVVELADVLPSDLMGFMEDDV